MNGEHKNRDPNDLLLHEAGIPLLHGPITSEEQAALNREKQAKAEKEADTAYKDRQIAVAEAANNLTRTSIGLTWVLAVFTALTAGAAWYQGCVSRKSLDAAASAARTAEQSLKLTRDMFEASQAAVFVSAFEIKTTPTHYPVWITVGIRNTGKTRASNVTGTIRLIRKTATGKIIQDGERTFSRPFIPADDEIAETIGVNGTWDNLRGYLHEDFRVTVELIFDDGVQRTKQTFCKGPVIQRGTDTGTSFAFVFEDCENIKARKQYGY